MALLLNQIQKWLKLPKLWRFVGFASALVGLLCFALSSSFNSLFGKWNFLKTFLYVIFSFFVCTAVLFAKTWQSSSSLRFKAHMAFLVLTITSLYSSFFDKHANGKPDAYSLVSCAAFAVMTLSLSRQTHCGIEVDLLYFFLGALILQLTKIKWLLGIVGAGFSYSLIILRCYLDALSEVNGYIELQDQPHVVIQVGSPELQASASSASTPVDTAQHKEGNTQDHAITKVDSHSQEASTDIALIKPKLSACIKELKEKNSYLIRLLRRTLRKPFQPDQNLYIDSLPSEIINNLNEAMKLAVAVGFEEQCCHLYSSCRKEFIRQCLLALKLQDFINEEDHNVCNATEMIRGWIKASKLAILILFPMERGLCERIFSGLSSSGDLSFMQICREPTIRLVNFAKTLSVEISSPKTLVEAGQVFMTLRGIIPELESLSSAQDDVSLSNEAIAIHKRLGEAIWDVFNDLENLIHSDTAVADVPGGICPITYDVMNCLDGILEVLPVLQKVLEEYPMVANRGGTSPLFLSKIVWIMELLESHLEAKSKNYIEPALGYVSMMNNTMYIKQKIGELYGMTEEHSENLLRLDLVLHSDQIQKHNAKVKRNIEDYLRCSWNEVLGLLELDIKEESMAPDVAAELMKEKLNLFNIQFEEICRIQSKWVAIDSSRHRIIRALENMLLPAYGNFIGRFHDVIGKHAYEYIQYGMFDIKARLNHIFLGGKRMN